MALSHLISCCAPNNAAVDHPARVSEPVSSAMAGPRVAYAAAGGVGDSRDRDRMATRAAHLDAAGSRFDATAGRVVACSGAHRPRHAGHRHSDHRRLHICSVSRRPSTKGAEDAPQTQMNLVLSAVFASSDPSEGAAPSSVSPRRHRKVYAVGVRSDRAPGCMRSIRIASSSIAAASSRRWCCRSRTPRQSARDQSRRLARRQYQFAENLRRIAETNPSAFAEVHPTATGIRQRRAARLSRVPGRNRQQFAKLGLQPGDLVLSINGTPLDDPQRGMEIFNTMGTSDRVTVTDRAQRAVAGADAQHGADLAARCGSAAQTMRRPQQARPTPQPALLPPVE